MGDVVGEPDWNFDGACVRVSWVATYFLVGVRHVDGGRAYRHLAWEEMRREWYV